MQIIGIDFGEKKIGLAIADSASRLSEPLKVIRFKKEDEAIHKISEVLKTSKASMIVVGVSEGKMGFQSKEFGKRLKLRLKVPVVFQDETLTTQEAQELSIEARVKRKKRHKFEDAYSATLILQSYLDNRGSF